MLLPCMQLPWAIAQKNEIVRENQFLDFEFSWSSGVSLMFLLLVLPAGVYTVYHDEMVRHVLACIERENQHPPSPTQRMRDTTCTKRETYKHML